MEEKGTHESMSSLEIGTCALEADTESAFESGTMLSSCYGNFFLFLRWRSLWLLIYFFYETCSHWLSFRMAWMKIWIWLREIFCKLAKQARVSNLWNSSACPKNWKFRSRFRQKVNEPVHLLPFFLQKMETLVSTLVWKGNWWKNILHFINSPLTESIPK